VQTYTSGNAFHFTEPEPFRLATSERGTMHEEAFKKQIEEEEKELERQRLFKAREYKEKPAFVPKKVPMPLTEITDVVLNSDRRAMQRKMWEKQRMEKELAYMEARKAQEIEEKV
jgi:hypothetical protein